MTKANFVSMPFAVLRFTPSSNGRSIDVGESLQGRAAGLSGARIMCFVFEPFSVSNL